jgi:formylglycine-generating enzyme required for sulfatase activity
MLAAAVLLSVGGAGALQLGWLDTWIMSTPGTIEGPAATAWLAEHRRQAAENRARDKELKKEKERLAAEAATKAEQEKLAAQAKAKAEERKKKEDAKAADEAEKAERERLAAEAKAAEQRKKDEDAQAAELKAKAEKERLAAAAMAKAAEQKKEAERRAAQQAANAQPVALELAPGVKIEFVPVPGGSFRMGTDLGTLEDLAKKTGAEQQHYLDETPAHRVEVPPFYIGRSPVTVAQFRAFVAATGYKTAAERRGEAFTLRDGAWQRTPGACWKNPGFQQGDDHPVVLVSFRDCEVFAAWVARTTRRPLRLPSETEWEYAARGPNAFLYPWGGQWDGHLANHFDASLKPFGLPDWKYPTDDDGFPFTSPVGKFGNQSWCGAVDLAGNVMQWCSDTCEPYPQSSTAPLLMVDEADVPSDTPRALRGGSYLSTPLDCRAAVRRCSSPRSASCEFGVRLAFTPDARTADERR